MIATNSIIFYLDTKLELYSLDSVNLAGSPEIIFENKDVAAQDYKPKLIDQIQPQIRLELYQDFEIFWKKNWPLLEQKIQDKVVNFYLILGSKAGFTNTRIVYLWLKSLQQFYNPKLNLGFIKNSENINLQTLEPQKLNTILSQAKPNLDYSMEPRIGGV